MYRFISMIVSILIITSLLLTGLAFSQDLKQPEGPQSGAGVGQQIESQLPNKQNYSTTTTEVIEIAGIAKGVMEVFEGHFKIITWAASALFLVIGWIGITDRAYQKSQKEDLETEKVEHKKLGDQHLELIKEIESIKKELLLQEKDVERHMKSLFFLNQAWISLPREDETGKYKEDDLITAQKNVEKAIAESPSHGPTKAWAYSYYAYILRRLESDDENGKKKALEFLIDALKKGVESSGIHYNIACYMSNKDEAKEHFMLAIKEDSSLLADALSDPDLKEIAMSYCRLPHSG